MKHVYYHYETWEDYQHGMYNEEKEGRKERINKAVELLTDEYLCFKFMTKVSNEWKHACEQTFTNNYNHQSFLGQCACCLFAGVHEDETREAWGTLSNEQRYKANAVADKVYKNWMREYQKRNGGYQCSLFDYFPELMKG